MDKFKLKTSIQFPFLKLNESVSYSEVKKPSGFAYMILVLINEVKDRSTNLANTLSNFGVSSSLYHIYADTINDLIHDEILEFKSGKYNKNKFSLYSIDNFIFTPKGKKVFSEGVIPTGKIKEIKIPIYYDIALKKLSFELSSDLEARPLMDSALTEQFIEGFKCERDVEDFINMNKGEKIPIYENGKKIKNELIKKEEIVTKVEERKKEYWTGKYDCILVLDNETLKFEFEDGIVQKFFHNNYTSEMVNSLISYKDKYKFRLNYSKNLNFSIFKNNKIVDIIIPRELDNVLKGKYQLIVSRGNYVVDNHYFIKSEDCIDEYNKLSEFIIVDNADNVYSYFPGVYNFSSELGSISIPLVLKIKVSSEELKKVLYPYIQSLNIYTEDNFKKLVSTTRLSKDYDLAFGILSGYISKDEESNIVLLNEMKKIATLDDEFLTKYKELVSLNFENYLNKVTENNLETFLKITKSVPSFLNISNKLVLDRIFESIGEVKNKVKVFEMLIENGFSKNIVILYVNPVEEVLKLKKANEKSLLDLLNYDNCIDKLKKLTKITDFKNYTFSEENIDKNEYKNIYSTARELQNNINYLKYQNDILFEDYEGYMSLFKKINDGFNMLNSAINNPNNIKRDLIEKKIASGDYQLVLISLSVKLESILKNKHNLKGTLSDMLNEFRKVSTIEKSIIDDLYLFKENRNACIHPSDRTSNFKVDDLRRWSNEIFDLEGFKK